MTTATQTQSQVQIGTRILWISLFTFLTGLGGWIEIPLPFTPVPVTLQTLAVVASGIVIGKDGLYSQILYLVLGGIGLPLFAGATGHWTYLFGATGGYLIGFVAASAICGKWIHPNWSNWNFWGKTWRLLAVSLLIFVPGVLQLALVLKLSFVKALALGFIPFIPGDLIKTFIAAGIPKSFIRKIS